MIWDNRESSNRFTQLLAISRRALAEKPDLLIWPEAAMPSFDAASFTAITNLISGHKVWMIFGADDVDRVGGSDEKPEYNFFNSAFLFDPESRLVATYRKRNLVIFGEYVPLTRWLPFLKYLTPIEGGFTPGDAPGRFTLTDPLARISPLICFEDIFPAFVRHSLAADTDLLVNLTNDGWFGESAAPWQHAATAMFRAVENGLPLLRCANNGLTCLVDSRGRIVQEFTDERGTIYGQGFMVATVPLGASEAQPTFYRQHGEWFASVCVVVAVAGVVRMKLKARRNL
jgi:apolipoprotein N-acyltransferase